MDANNLVACPRCGHSNERLAKNCGGCGQVRSLASMKAEVAAVPATRSVQIANTDQSQTLPDVQKIARDVNELLIEDETILYIAMQGMKAGIRKDAMIATDRRLLRYRPAMMGKFNLDDWPWNKVEEVRVNQGMMTSEFRFKLINGAIGTMGNLDKEQTRKLYAICQTKVHEWHEIRRQRQMEEDRARAGGVTVQTAFTPPMPQPVATPLPAPTEDPVARLAKAKALLDQGLISQEEYDELKAKIVASI